VRSAHISVRFLDRRQFVRYISSNSPLEFSTLSVPVVSLSDLKFLIFPELVRKHQGKIPLERPRRKWKDIMKMALKTM
jgi:hypothetical protein